MFEAHRYYEIADAVEDDEHFLVVCSYAFHSSQERGELFDGFNDSDNVLRRRQIALGAEYSISSTLAKASPLWIAE